MLSLERCPHNLRMLCRQHQKCAESCSILSNINPYKGLMVKLYLSSIYWQRSFRQVLVTEIETHYPIKIWGQD